MGAGNLFVKWKWACKRTASRVAVQLKWAAPIQNDTISPQPFHAWSTLSKLCLYSCISPWLCAIQQPMWITSIHQSNQAELRGMYTRWRLIWTTSTQNSCMNDRRKSCFYKANSCMWAWRIPQWQMTRIAVKVHVWETVNERFSVKDTHDREEQGQGVTVAF